MNVEIILDWKHGEPELSGLYFVAVKYGESAGAYDFIEWNGRAWELESDVEIVGYLDIQDFKKQLNIRWPSPEKKMKKTVSDDEPWSEA